ncbi:carboxypeptidase-like regulatory domain-containing protein [Winogradskyella immobilis]|uniref:Carboxypeptidase-like regulatory domain-containing protein n=1 Tax=Winogradskyella immobilis TaxID=2816852 RepID=A0ABS8EK82_9FLAO|nr:carboxypeptidase-like regulatory domain-containing protein [Winogradskyella immobilis]MCC1483603.1 carboxypeptidase-like regulatory domain-containing protein [Winogradskyella immobilis]MCG0015697.1 carboxypeptidase-like regulatory domain-containing protein [Winogradskyella immobilis]
MKNYLLVLLCSVSVYTFGQDSTNVAQEPTKVIATIISSTTKQPLSNANIVNLNQVIGTATDDDGIFEIRAKTNDTLLLSYIGYKTIKVRVTNDWIKFGNTEIEMTDLALALEEVVVNQLKLTGYLEVDIKQIPVTTNNRFRISGIPNQAYEGGQTNVVNKVLGAIFNPADFLYKMFGRKPNEMRKLKQIKKDDEIRNQLAKRFDREMLTALLQVNKYDLDEIVNQCNYSRDFIRTANDLQVLDAISECYEEYKVLNRNAERKKGKKKV